MLVREPYQLGLERAHPQLAFGVRLVELAKPKARIFSAIQWLAEGRELRYNSSPPNSFEAA